MDLVNFFIQLLNSVQYGLLLFLLAAGLTLIFGIMGVVNLAHGSFYMLGAYMAYALTGAWDSLALAIAAGTVLSVAFGWLLEKLLFRHFYHRSHLDQVLLTFGLIYIFEELRSMLWGDDVHSVGVPAALDWSIQLTDTLSYPAYRLFMLANCGNNTLPKVSTKPTNKAAVSAPRTEPMPPMTTTTKHMISTCEPMCG